MSEINSMENVDTNSQCVNNVQASLQQSNAHTELSQYSLENRDMSQLTTSQLTQSNSESISDKKHIQHTQMKQVRRNIQENKAQEELNEDSISNCQNYRIKNQCQMIDDLNFKQTIQLNPGPDVIEYDLQYSCQTEKERVLNLCSVQNVTNVKPKCWAPGQMQKFEEDFRQKVKTLNPLKIETTQTKSLEQFVYKPGQQIKKGFLGKIQIPTKLSNSGIKNVTKNPENNDQTDQNEMEKPLYRSQQQDVAMQKISKVMNKK